MDENDPPLWVGDLIIFACGLGIGAAVVLLAVFL